MILKCLIWLNECKAILECLALDLVWIDNEIFDIRIFNLIQSMQSNLGMLSIRFGVDGWRNIWYWNIFFYRICTKQYWDA